MFISYVYSMLTSQYPHYKITSLSNNILTEIEISKKNNPFTLALCWVPSLVSAGSVTRGKANTETSSRVLGAFACVCRECYQGEGQH